jgi:hypothetical protein
MSQGFITVNGTPANAQTTSITLPTHAVNDILVVWAVTSLGTTPSVPAASGTVPTWVTVDTLVGNSANSVLAYAIATATNHTSGTWTNAGALGAINLSGVDTTNPVGGHAGTTGSDASPNASAITMSVATGTSFVLECYGVVPGGSTTWSAVPGGYTRQTAVDGTVSKSGVCLNNEILSTSGAAIVNGVSLSRSWAAEQVEFLAIVNQPQPDYSQFPKFLLQR